jgi:hypothetical protein
MAMSDQQSDQVVELGLMREQLRRAQEATASPVPPYGGSGGGSSSGGMEARLAKVEADIGHIQQDIADMKGDIRGLRDDARCDFRTLFGALIATALGLAGLMAKGFHWF